MHYNRSKEPQFGISTSYYSTGEDKIKMQLYDTLNKRFYQSILKAKPDNIFIMEDEFEFICFQVGTKAYYFDQFSKQVKPLGHF